ncbi:hypothetical protein D3C72_2022100 [compost metagenome]
MGRAFAIVGRKAHAHETDMQAGGAGLVQCVAGVFQDGAAAHLLSVGGAAVGTVGVDQIVFHVQH